MSTKYSIGKYCSILLLVSFLVGCGSDSQQHMLKDKITSLVDKGKYKEALYEIDESGISDAEILALRGECYYNLDDYARAKNSLGLAVKMRF